MLIYNIRTLTVTLTSVIFYQELMLNLFLDSCGFLFDVVPQPDHPTALRRQRDSHG